ncbi:MAG: hypothetical protein II655_07505, partial [Thermoguttaceae bacterium]|nr:hypothetical protein [Thermoguttaceae bacterium]
MPSRLSFVVLAVVALAASFSSRARAQGWKLYAEQLRGGAAEETTEAPTVSSGGALDLSSVLVDDGAEATGSVVEDPREPTAAVFASLPSYRSLASLRSDARLNDLCFVSATTGWVVGDRGTILKTTDGGATWTACESPTDANLYGVSFLDANFGLAVGGRSQTSTVGQGVALRTTDGGATWSEIPLAAYPILRAARILDAETAWIAGDSSNLYPSGLFVGTESCEIWTPVALSRAEGWRSALYDPAVGLGLGATTSGKIQRAEGDRAELIATELGRLRARDVCYDGATGAAWLVGD